MSPDVKLCQTVMFGLCCKNPCEDAVQVIISFGCRDAVASIELDTHGKGASQSRKVLDTADDPEPPGT